MDSMIEYKVRHIKDFSGKILDLNVRKGFHMKLDVPTILAELYEDKRKMER